MWTSIQKIIPRKIKELGLEQVMALVELQKNWDDILEPALSAVFKKKSQPVKIHQQTLFVKCLNSVWASELQIKENRVLDALNDWRRGPLIQKIKFFS
jgi:predicted nucleic acid-binding Zn ribbon protein